jgi:hypothetical protein
MNAMRLIGHCGARDRCGADQRERREQRPALAVLRTDAQQTPAVRTTYEEPSTDERRALVIDNSPQAEHRR